jgi:ubiquinol oxidase
MTDEHLEYEQLIESLNDDTALAAYKTPLDDYRPALLPRILGGCLVWCGNIVYGVKPSYSKFRAIEVIARVPYHSWASALFTLLTLFYTDEKRAVQLSTLSRFTTFAADNETMHVVVISQLARLHAHTGILRYTIIPVLFSFFYFWMSYLMYLVNPRWSLETNYLFEQHAFAQYSIFLADNEEMLKSKPIESEFLEWYGRHPRSEYEFFCSVRNDELVHRNRSIHEIALHKEHAIA